MRTLRKRGHPRRSSRCCVDLKDGRGEIDDIDHLGNRRVRSVGELMENQYRVGLLRMERAIRERMSSVEIDTVMPHDLINAKPAAAAVREFFGSLAALAVHGPDQPAVGDHAQAAPLGAGPGRPDARARRLRGARRASDALRPHLPDRDAGRPEHRPDQLARHLRAGEPVRLHREPVPQGRDGRGHRRGRSTSRRWRRAATRSPRPTPRSTRRGKFVSELVQLPQGRRVRPGPARGRSTSIDVSPKQLVSVAAALIPFLENDDANRALMGSNMQRQAVPLIQAEAPLVGTGMEEVVARDSGVAIAARRTGVVDQVDATRIVVRATDEVGADRPAVDIYNLLKFQRSNQNTCITQRPLVKVGDQVKEGDIIADGPSTARRRAGARPQRARRLHAVERLQLRGLDPDLRAHRARRRLHLDPHRGVRGHGPRHQARPGGDHAATSRTSARRR